MALRLSGLAKRGAGFHSGPSKGQKIDSMVVRETGGDDEAVAFATAQAKGKDGDISAEIVALSIAEVNGEPIAEPTVVFQHMNTKARNIASRAWRRLNALDDKDDEAIFGEAELCDG